MEAAVTSLPNRCLAAVALVLALNAAALSAAALVLGVPFAWSWALSLASVPLVASVLALLWLRPLRRDLALVAELVAGRVSDSQQKQSARTPRTAEASALFDSVALVRARSAELERVELETRRAVEEAERLRVSFVAAMGHDLRGPLNSVIGFSDLLVMEGHDPVAVAQRPSVEIIRRGAQDLLVLLEQILVWAKLEAGQLTLTQDTVEVADVIGDAVRDAVAQSGDRGLRVELEVANGLPPLHADRARLAQALLGLMDHATRAPDRPRIVLVACVLAADEQQPRRVRIELRDPQLSVREADHQSFFEAFRASYAPSGRRLGGLGLGPALGRALIRAHGGQVWFASRSDTGTTFTVELPTAADRHDLA
jgi:signal transduction histidine kinase